MYLRLTVSLLYLEVWKRNYQSAPIAHDSDFEEFAVQKSRGQEASTSDGAGPPSFLVLSSGTMHYPFEQRFIFAVENLDWQENPWLILIASDGLQPERLIDTLKENGYSQDSVRKNIALLKALELENLVGLAMLPDYRSEPALAALKTRTTEDVFAKAQSLSQSSSNERRALAVKILNSPYQRDFLKRTKSVLQAMQLVEEDELVLEQLGYAFSKLQSTAE